jgi:predicted enzyme related to lactoylglutathione lyase
MKLKEHLMKHHYVLSMVVKDLGRVKTFYPELYAMAVEALKDIKKELAKVSKDKKNYE